MALLVLSEEAADVDADELWLEMDDGDFLKITELLLAFAGRRLAELPRRLAKEPPLLVLFAAVAECRLFEAANDDEQTDTFVVSLWMLERLVDLPAASKLHWLACLEAAAETEAEDEDVLLALRPLSVVEVTEGFLSWLPADF